MSVNINWPETNAKRSFCWISQHITPSLRRLSVPFKAIAKLLYSHNDQNIRFVLGVVYTTVDSQAGHGYKLSCHQNVGNNLSSQEFHDANSCLKLVLCFVFCSLIFLKILCLVISNTRTRLKTQTWISVSTQYMSGSHVIQIQMHQ